MTKKLLRMMVLLGLLTTWGGEVQAQSWITRCVDCPKYVTSLTDRSLALDAAGRPHVAYGGDHLYYAWHDGTTWQRETADGAPAVGAQAALGLDGANQPHIAYHDLPQDAIKYAYRDAAGWHVETIEDNIDNDAPQISLAVDSQGRAHVAYEGHAWAYGYGLQYARRDAAGWTPEYVTNPGLEITGLSLALDGDDKAQIGFVLEEGANLGHAYRDDDAWHYQYASTGLGHPYGVSLALDDQGRPRVALDGGSALWYGWNDGGGWQFEVAGNQGSDSPSLALDNGGQPWISYHDRSSGQLVVSHKEGAAWQAEVALAGDDVYYVSGTSLAVDGSGRPQVVTNRRSSLKYAQNDGEGWLREIVEETAAVGRFNALEIDSQGRAHIAYYDQSQGRIKYARDDAGGWHVETLPIEGERNAFGQVSLALDGGDLPHVVYPEYEPASASYRLRYVYWNGLAWQGETVAGEWGQYVSLALSGTGVPHVGYYVGYPDNDVKYAHRGGSGWEVEVVHDHTDGPGYVSLKVDSLGIPHIAYSSYAYSPVAVSQIVYGSLGASGWQTETVGTGGGGAVSLALDGSDAPHLAFTDYSSIYYAQRQARSWVVEAVDDGYHDVSMALDGEGAPAIAYVQIDPSYRKVVRFAQWEDAAWERSSIHIASSWYDEDLSLDLDPAGSAVVVFQDRDTRDLIMAESLVMDHVLYLPLVTRQ